MKTMLQTSLAKQLKTLCLILLVLSGTTLFAQHGDGSGQGNGMGGGNGMGRNATPEQRAKRQTEMMKDNLDLTAAQEPKVQAINLKYANKMQDVRKMTDTAAQRKSAMALNKQKETELKAILTANQFKEYQKMMAEFMARRKR